MITITLMFKKFHIIYTDLALINPLICFLCLFTFLLKGSQGLIRDLNFARRQLGIWGERFKAPPVAYRAKPWEMFVFEPYQV